ncbi:hypothetical protein [Microtetraspora niveoalba]|uniref:hypothetical protein n=1 Tax=Microtetraspora niveoalba TaxID=46175 RepID=UPI00082A8CC4|nr:hypothetical protein [Microtetraspora niveoalba]
MTSQSQGFTGVKQPDFDTMTAGHTRAAGQLDRLAQALYGELQGAGLDTGPALRLRDLARRVGTQAEDLRRRQAMVHEMERQQVAFGVCTPDGTLFGMPDALDSARGFMDGTLAGRAAASVASGDTAALAELEKYTSKAGNGDFVTAFLRQLGAKGVTELPGSLAAALRAARLNGETEALAGLSAQGRKTLRMLSDILARATDPKNPAYMGDRFLKDLAEQGRARHTSGDVESYAGYQAQALIWAAHEGKPPFSRRFMEVVGRDAVVYEQEQYKERWSFGEGVGLGKVPLYDLSAALGLGGLLKPGARVVAKDKASVMDGLLRVAGSDKDAAHALLDHTPPGWKQSVLAHLLTTRLDAFHFSGEFAALERVLLAGTTGQDPTSRKLAAEMTGILADEVRGAFGKAGDGNLEIADKEALDRLAPLRYPLARAVAANIDQLSRLLLHHDTFGKVAAQDMSYALALATTDEVGFEALIRAQTEHMRAALDTVPPVGLDRSNLKRFGFTEADLKLYDFDEDGRVGKADVHQFLVDRTVAEARPFGHLVEIRRQALIAEGQYDQKADEALRAMVRDAIGLFPVPGAKQVGELASGAFGKLLTSQYDKLTGSAYDEVSKQVAQVMATEGRSLDATHAALADNRLAVERLTEQMIATTMLKKGMLDRVALKDRTFTTGSPPRIKPFAEMSPEQYISFLNWTRWNGGSNDLLDRFQRTFRDTTEVDDYLSLQIPASPGGGK